ncbi:MAG: hypothetical protein Kow00104_04840 [Rhodothalassiaceae bacterium]
MTYKSKHAFWVPALLLLAACDGGDSTEQARAPSEEALMRVAEASASYSGEDYTKIVSAGSMSESGFALGPISIGNPDAPVTIIEYASLTCPHCAEFEHEVLKKLMDSHIRTGIVRFEFRNFVMNRYDLAVSALVRCRGAEQFYPLSDLFFSSQAQWLRNARAAPDQVMDDIAAVARKAGISRTEFDRCLADRDIQTHLIEMTSSGQTEWQITGTPTIIVDGKKRGPEAQDYATLVGMIEDAR